MTHTELRKLAEAAKGWNVNTVIPATEEKPCQLGTMLDDEFYHLIQLECEDYYKDSVPLAVPLANYIAATSPDAVLALLDEVARLHHGIEKLHTAKGRYHTQLAVCDLFDLCGLKNERPVK